MAKSTRTNDDYITIYRASERSQEVEQNGQLYTFDSYSGVITGADYARLGIDLSYQREPQSDEYVAKMKDAIKRRRIVEVTVASREGKFHIKWTKVRDKEGIERDQMQVLVKSGQTPRGEFITVIVDGQSRQRSIRMMLDDNGKAAAAKLPLPYPDIEIACHCIMNTTPAIETDLFNEINDLGIPINPNLSIRNLRQRMQLAVNGDLKPQFTVLRGIYATTTENPAFPFYEQCYWGVKLPRGRRGISVRVWIRLLLELCRLKGARLATDNMTMVLNLQTIASTMHLESEEGGPRRMDGTTQVIENFVNFCGFLNRALNLSEALDRKVKPVQCQSGLLMAYARILSLPQFWVGSDDQATDDEKLFELEVPEDIATNLSNVKILKDAEVARLAPSNKLNDRIALAKHLVQTYLNPRRGATRRIDLELLERRKATKPKKTRRRKTATKAKPKREEG